VKVLEVYRKTLGICVALIDSRADIAEAIATNLAPKNGLALFTRPVRG
jgi:hypothetical protein